MRTLRRKVQVQEGVEVQMLFTPHLFSFKGYKGLTFEVEPDAAPSVVFEMYADVLYAAALNAWVLDGDGSLEGFALTRGDFHEYMAREPKAFAADVAFAVEALTGKNIKDLSAPKTEAEAEPGKKKVSRWTGMLSRRSS